MRDTRWKSINLIDVHGSTNAGEQKGEQKRRKVAADEREEGKERERESEEQSAREREIEAGWFVKRA